MAEESDKFRSFRFACDRCRSHKLKCPQNPSSTIGACQRCTRAKAQCTFSPRARPARSAQNASLTQEKAIQEAGRRDGSQSPGAPGPPSPAGAENPPPQQPDQQGPSRWEPSWGQLDVLGATHQHTFHADAAVASSDFAAGMSMGSAFMDCSPFAEPPSGPTMHHTPFNFQFDMNQFGDLPDCVGSIEASVGAKGDEDIAMTSAETSTCPKEDCTKKLTSLAVEFQRHLMLINSYSTGVASGGGADAQHWLSTYPIGEILCLSGDFASLLKPELYQHGRGASVSICENDGGRTPPPSGCTQVGRKERHDTTIGSDVAHRNHPNTPESISSASTPSPTTTISSRPSSSSVSSSTSNGVDTPMALLILNCYVSMIRIYSALFAHLYAHLGRATAGPGLRSTDPGLKFGELPAVGDDVSLRTYTAVRLLLAALQHSEELLDLPDDLRCVLVSAPNNDREEAAASSSSSEASSAGSEAEEQRMGLAERVLGRGGREMIASELARAVFRQEAQMSAELGGGGLMLLRKNIEGVKTSLRQRMQL